jgi:mRNA interferase RelE/StbE
VSWGCRPGGAKVYSVEFKPSAARALRRLARDVQSRIAEKIDSLARNPFPRGVSKLQGEENTYRVRVGDYRIIYEVQSRVLLVLVLKIGHRREIYR